MFEKIGRIHCKKPAMQSFFVKLSAQSFVSTNKQSHKRCFRVNFANFFTAAILQSTCEQLLLASVIRSLSIFLANVVLAYRFKLVHHSEKKTLASLDQFDIIHFLLILLLHRFIIILLVTEANWFSASKKNKKNIN